MVLMANDETTATEPTSTASATVPTGAPTEKVPPASETPKGIVQQKRRPPRNDLLSVGQVRKALGTLGVKRFMETKDQDLAPTDEYCVVFPYKIGQFFIVRPLAADLIWVNAQMSFPEECLPAFQELRTRSATSDLVASILQTIGGWCDVQFAMDDQKGEPLLHFQATIPEWDDVPLAVNIGKSLDVLIRVMIACRYTIAKALGTRVKAPW